MSIIGDSRNIIFNHPIKENANNSAEPDRTLPRSFTINRNMLWNRGVVPYEVDHNFDDYEVRKIGKAMKLFHVVSCVRWVPRTTEKNYVRFTRSQNTCASQLGKIGGRQIILMKSDCFYKEGYRGALVHEMMHALGFIHEQQRMDRDCYIRVTGRGKELNDIKYVKRTDTFFPYDFNSLMQYKQRDFMEARNGERLGNMEGTLTEEDKAKLNYLYCGQPHYCTLNPQECEEMEKAERLCKAPL